MSRKYLCIAIVIMMVSFLPISTLNFNRFYVNLPEIKQSSEQARFIISTWSFPDEFGQGIDGFRFYENSTGSWVAAPWYNELGSFYYLHSYDAYSLNWSGGVAMKLRVYTLINQSYLGISSTTEGQKYFRHSVEVTHLGETIFSQQNFTYVDVIDLGEGYNYYYWYEIVLEFIPQEASIYCLLVTYEIFMPEYE